MKKLLSGVIIAVFIVGGVSFYGGMRYERSTRTRIARQNFGGQQFGANGLGMRGRNGGAGGMIRGGGLTRGEIIAKDDKSITVKLNDGGSKIIFLSGKITITQSVVGVPNDLQIGASVFVNGTPNDDGSMNAETIQLSPVLIPPQKK